jgi:hypothetical protein
MNAIPMHHSCTCTHLASFTHTIGGLQVDAVYTHVAWRGQAARSSCGWLKSLLLHATISRLDVPLSVRRREQKAPQTHSTVVVRPLNHAAFCSCSTLHAICTVDECWSLGLTAKSASCTAIAYTISQGDRAGTSSDAVGSVSHDDGRTTSSPASLVRLKPDGSERACTPPYESGFGLERYMKALVPVLHSNCSNSQPVRLVSSRKT